MSIARRRDPECRVTSRQAHMRRNVAWCLSCLLALFVGSTALGCARPYDMTPSASFRPYDDSSDLKLITPDGVMVKVREVENYPKASLAFWTDAMSRHLERQGYAVKSQKCFKTTSGLDGCTATFLLPHGAEDWVLSETVFVADDTVFLVEAAGPFERFAKVEAEYAQSLATFRVK